VMTRRLLWSVVEGWDGHLHVEIVRLEARVLLDQPEPNQKGNHRDDQRQSRYPIPEDTAFVEVVFGTFDYGHNEHAADDSQLSSQGDPERFHHFNPGKSQLGQNEQNRQLLEDD